jgi:hypothetical protein
MYVFVPTRKLCHPACPTETTWELVKNTESEPLNPSFLYRIKICILMR